MTESRRALILAGGGIRVAWQTGVVSALGESGLRFEHGDGSSGGIFTLAMLLSGQSPAEMGEHWRSLRIRDFLTPLPLREYLTSPTNWSAFGGNRGIREDVLAGLGIDLAAVRASSGMTGSFNVADFSTKQCVPIPHTEIDEDRLVAGVSLAGVMPAIQHGGRMWTDAVWIKDANLTDAVQRGCTELWVLWCIANNPRWGTGALEQYVHMIEMSANAALFAELEWIREVNARRAAGDVVFGTTTPVTVHLIKPRLPIPLDVDLVAGRIDAETLIAMGYRDGWGYLDAIPVGGIALDETATATPVRPLGARVSLRSRGRMSSFGPARCTLVVEADDLQGLIDRPGSAFSAVGTWHDRVHGLVMFATTSVTIDGGHAGRRLRADAKVRLAGVPHDLEIVVPLRNERLRGARAHQWTLRDAAGTIIATGAGRMSLRQSVRALASFEPAGAHNLRERAEALALAARLVRRNAATSSDRTDPQPVAGAPSPGIR